MSTDRQEYGADAQRSAILEEAQRRGWELIWKEDIGRSGKSIQRPHIQAALRMLRDGEAAGIIVGKLDRLARSVVDFSTLVRQSQEEGWAIVCLEPRLDLTTMDGRLFANLLASFAEFEREMIQSRVRAGLAEARKKGKVLGRPRMTASDIVVKRIQREHAKGTSLHAIARELNEDQVPTTRKGKQWYPGTVRSILQTYGEGDV